MARRSTTKTAPEDEVVQTPSPQSGPVPEPRGGLTPGDPGACGETPCWSRTEVAFTDSAAGLTVTLTPAWPGNIVWDFGDGSDPVMGRGPVEHTYAGAGTYTVTASPVASSCLKTGTASVTV